jgi:hypothetical protein
MERRPSSTLGPGRDPRKSREVGAAGGPVACSSSHGQGSRGRAPGRFRTRRNRNACEEGAPPRPPPSAGSARNRRRSHHPAGGRSRTTPVPAQCKLTPCSLGAVRVQEKGGRQVRPCRPSRSAGAAPAALSSGRTSAPGVPLSSQSKPGRRRGGTREPPLANAGLLKPARPPRTGAAPAPMSVPPQSD